MLGLPHRARPSSPFLPASTVSSAADPFGSFGAPQVCCTLQPAMGFARFRAPATTPRKSSPPVPSPLAHTLRSVPLPGGRSIVTADPARERWAFTDRAQSTDESVPPSRRFRARTVDASLGLMECDPATPLASPLALIEPTASRSRQRARPWTCPFGEGPAPEPRTTVHLPCQPKRTGRPSRARTGMLVAREHTSS